MLPKPVARKPVQPAAGTAPRSILDPDSDMAQLRTAALDALHRWQRHAENPLSDRAATDAARVVVRSCEGLLAQALGPPAT